MIKVFYDDQCKLCRREIEYYKNVSEPTSFEWCKLSKRSQELKKFGIQYEESLKSLHAIDSVGVLKTGVDAFIIIWQEMAGWRWLATFVSMPIIYQFSKLIYAGFSKWRFNRLNHCKEC